MHVRLDFANPDDFCSSDIQAYLKTGGEHPATLHSDLFSEDPPDVALTYEWTLVFEEIFSFLSEERLKATRRDWRLKQPLSNDLRIWIDILFIDQVQ